MAEYPMDLGSGLPHIHQELIHIARMELRSDPAYIQHLAESLAAQNTHLWNDLNVEATKLAGDDNEVRQKLMKVGVHVLDLVGRASYVQALESALIETPESVAITTESEIPPKKRIRQWLAGQVALVGFGFSMFRSNRTKNDDVF